MNVSPTEAKPFVTQLSRSVGKGRSQIIIYPQFPLLGLLAEAFKGTGICVGAQNCHWELQGAFTGETSPQLLKQLGIEYCLVGHSERRHLFGETILDTGKKVKTLQNLEITPMICVGETDEEREKGQTDKVILSQLEGALRDADLKKNFVVAYEPVWAIGTGKVATPELAQKAHAALRRFLKDQKLENTTILYGGSVKPDNTPGLNACPDIDGFLVGGASLDAEAFAKICLLTLNAMR